MISNQPHYRRDIDGLRAVAVSAVVLFHLNEALIPTGFLGVDMFFVISGYLITGILARDLRLGSFSIATFYKRRIRRLLPALVAMMSVVSLAAYLLLVPSDLVGFGQSLVSAIGFVANIYFWRDTNYFAAAAELKPLLNLWSLGVEEQFYIVFPVALWILVRLRWPLLPFVWTMVALSLALDHVLRQAGGEAPAFYLFPTRAWELGCGAIAALTPRPAFGVIWSRVLSLLAAILIAGSFSPGSWLSQASLQSIPLIAGTSLLIWIGAPERSVIGRALSWPPIRFIGLISYSLYLWHWPIIVLAKYYLIRPLTAPEAALVGATSVAVAAVSWLFIELPFRNRARFFTVATFSGVSALALTAFAAVALSTAGLSSRLPSEAAAFSRSIGTNYRCPVSELRPFGASRACDLSLNGQPIEATSVALIGNSHAQMYAPLVKKYMSNAGIASALFPLNACLPTVTINISPSCLRAAARNLNELSKLPNLAVIIIAFDWPFDRELSDASGNTIRPKDGQALLRGVNDLVARLSGKRVVLVGPIKPPEFEIASVLSRQIAYGRLPRVSYAAPAEEFIEKVHSIALALDARSETVLIRPDTVQCHDEVCDFVREDVVLFADDNHLAEPALSFFRDLWEDGLDAALRRD